MTDQGDDSRLMVACPGCGKSVRLRSDATLGEHNYTADRVRYPCAFVGKRIDGQAPGRRVTVTVTAIVPGAWSEQDAQVRVGRALREGLPDEVFMVCSDIGQPPVRPYQHTPRGPTGSARVAESAR